MEKFIINMRMRDIHFFFNHIYDMKIRYSFYHLMVIVNYYYILDQQMYYVTFYYRKFKKL